MKRFGICLLSLLMAFSLLAGCGEEVSSVPVSSTPDGADPMEFDAAQYVTLCAEFEYRISAAAEEHDAAVKNYLEQYAEKQYEPKTGKVKKGDLVNIDYVGTKDGVAFEGGTASNYNLEIGSDSFIAGFESGLIGKSTGKTVKLNLTFPESYHNKEMAGQKVIFTVTINYICGEGYYTEEQRQDAQVQVTASDLLEQIIARSEFRDPPEALYRKYYDSYSEQYSAALEQQYGYTQAQIASACGQYAASQSQYVIAVKALAKEFGLSVTEEEYQQYAAGIGASYNMTGAQVISTLGAGEVQFRTLIGKVNAELYARYLTALENEE